MNALYMNGWFDRLVDGLVDGWLYGRMDKSTDGFTLGGNWWKVEELMEGGIV